jgi:hydroxypyruvate isomerase
VTEPHALRLDANLGWLFTEVPFEQRFERAAAAGFGAVEFPSPYGYRPEPLRRRLDDAGLQQIQINAPMGEPGTPTGYGTAGQPDRRAEFRDGVRRALDYAGALGARVIHVPAGIRPPGVDRDHAFAQYVANIGWAAELAAGTGVVLALEAINQRDAPGFILESIEQAAGVVRALRPLPVGLQFDVYHCQVSGGDLATRLRALMPLVAHIQVADVPGRNEPGTGEIGWPFLFELIGTLGYEGWIGCEYRPLGDTVEGLAWRRRLGWA